MGTIPRVRLDEHGRRGDDADDDPDQSSHLVHGTLALRPAVRVLRSEHRRVLLLQVLEETVWKRRQLQWICPCHTRYGRPRHRSSVGFSPLPLFLRPALIPAFFVVVLRADPAAVVGCDQCTRIMEPTARNTRACGDQGEPSICLLPPRVKKYPQVNRLQYPWWQRQQQKPQIRCHGFHSSDRSADPASAHWPASRKFTLVIRTANISVRIR